MSIKSLFKLAGVVTVYIYIAPVVATSCGYYCAFDSSPQTNQVGSTLTCCGLQGTYSPDEQCVYDNDDTGARQNFAGCCQLQGKGVDICYEYSAGYYLCGPNQYPPECTT
ncbi:hypothetical protein PSV09DRAFT_2034455 [Bipolaris maydis]|uniref:uncharacterized protein n=1 Tax=Cochliobolus heterostrophus TaxID=5016 RepID=UPI0024D6DCDF|nr:hypothetical protein J3E73DRAFT_32620 [Bipolaris maydis]KAJ6203489.1 hypothetical protein PSV09DRAFT_2034455 [Bipolaris maydis]KAJ6271758.1 hypothetical protein PSV08DRAFT_35305 [Bipolaris maydis]